MKSEELFNLPASLEIFKSYFSPDVEPWAWLSEISKALKSKEFLSLKNRTDIPVGLHIEGDVYIHKSVKLPPFGVIQGPCFIGEGCELRPSVYIRGNVIVGANCVLGNSCEFKNCLLLDNVQVPHFNYVGDSILGNKSHLGAGVILANLKLDKSNVHACTKTGRVQTNLRKFGAILADEAECGCNSVLQPGTILDKRAIVLSGIAYAGYLDANMMYYEKAGVAKKIRRLK